MTKAIKAVIDTNIWVAGLLASTGPPARVVDLALNAAVVPVVSPPILEEYERVLLRPELRLSAADVKEVLAYLRVPGAHVVHVDPIEPDRVCADPDDDVFVAAALAGSANYLVTGNLKHYPASPWRGIVIITPAEFLQHLQE